MAGGPNDYAASSGIYVLRKTATGTFEEIPVRYSTGAGKANSNVAIQAGDIVVVP
jgi:hypothetical protein